jgi:starch synthase (maltosyl-transferring)
VRDWNQAGNTKEFIGRVNKIRHDNRALRQFLNLQFLNTDNDQILFFAKATPDKDNVILVAVNLDPVHAQACTALVPPDVVGVAPGRSYRVTDLLTGTDYVWSDRNYVRLDPALESAHILRVEKRL